MLKLLIKLWWLQQRRNFHKRDAIVGGYIIFLYVVMGVGFFTSFTQTGGSLEGEDLPATIGIGIAIAMLIPDIFLKMVMKRDITAMDDYVKSRPVPEKIWNRFLLLTNVVSFWNYVLPVMMLPVFIFLLPSAGQIVGSFLLFLAFSYVNGIYITCYRKATEWMLKWPLVLGWMGMFAVGMGYVFIASFFPVWMAWTGSFVLAASILGGLTLYLYNLRIYNEQKRKASRFRGFSHISLFSLQYIGTMRAKRIRNMVIVITAIFLFDSYLFAFMPAEPGHEAMTTTPLIIYVVGAVLLPATCLSQWTFGVEANFFQGLMTKPVKVAQMLQNCFYFYCVVSAIALLLVVPFVFISDEITAFTLMGAFGLAVFINLFNLPTCLFSSRLEIFSSSMFSMQGANLRINLYAAAFLLPLGVLAAVYYLLGDLAWCGSCIFLGIMSVVIHKWAVGKIAAVFYKNRYKRMEKFMEN